MKTYNFGKFLLVKQPSNEGFVSYFYEDTEVSVSLYVSPDFVDPKTTKKKKHYKATYQYGISYIESIERGYENLRLREGDSGFTPQHLGYHSTAEEAFGVLRENIEYRIRLLQRWK